MVLLHYNTCVCGGGRGCERLQMEEEDEQWLILSFLCIVHTLDYDQHLQSSNRTETQSLSCTKLSFTWDPVILQHGLLVSQVKH